MKRKRNSKVISLLLAVMMIVTSLPFAGISAFAATSGDFEYLILDDGTAEITDYTGEAETLEIPATLDGYTVTSIGSFAFAWCDSLAIVTIPDSVTSIGDSAFAGCDSLTSVTIPNSVTSIGYDAFGWCDSLTSITVDENNNYYSSQDGVLFNKEKTELIQYPIGNERTSYSIPDGVKSIGDNAFESSKSLTDITIPDSVTSIGYFAFDGTGYYNDDANWENGVLYIGNHLIEANNDVIYSEYSINEGTITIANHAFFYCESLTSITIPESITSIGDLAFVDCYNLTNITVDENNKNYSSQDGVLFNKEKTELIQYPAGNDRTSYSIPDGVTSIGDSAFEYGDSLTSVTIPDSVTSIGNQAFWNCNKIKSVDIGNGLTSIGGNAFLDCDSLTSITIPNSLTSIGEQAFEGCDSLTSITVDENNKNYSSQDGVLFNKEKTELIQYPIGNERTSYNIPDSVTIIGDSAFEDCNSLTSISIPDSVTSIGYGAFDNCTSLTSVTIPGSVTSIRENTFWGCSSLTNITIPDSVTSIDYSAFEYCGNLTSITIPDSVTSIGSNAFYDTGYYNDDTNWENGVLYIGNHLVDANSDEHGEVPAEYSINEGTITIADYAFAYCDSLTSITIPNSVTSIGDGAFEDSALEIIYGYENSYAQTYAEENGYEFISLGSVETGEPGDVNGDGKINALDVLIVKRYIAKYDDAKLEGDMFAHADVSGDGKVNAKDALAIMQKIAKLIDDFNEIK